MSVSTIADDSISSVDSCEITKKQTRGRVKIQTKFIQNKTRRYTTFSKRKSGIMKNAYELATLTGIDVMLLVESEIGKEQERKSNYDKVMNIIIFRSCLYLCNSEIKTNHN